MEKQLKHISKFMSLVLRHQPEQIGLTLDEHGWAHTQELIEKINLYGIGIDLQMLRTIVATNDKKRFAFNEDQSMIRASQGHSLEVDLQLETAVPPEFLYHGTATRFVDQILLEGLKKQQRHHIHLSPVKTTALDVGGRHGKPVILKVAAGRMHEAGYPFYISANGVWLADEIPAAFLEPDQD